MTIEEYEDEMDSHGCCERNKLSICLLCFVIFLLLVLFLAAFFFLSYIGLFPEAQEQTTCLTFACIEASAQITALIDDTVDPCEDFYSFVCGKFERIAYEKQTDNILNAERERIKRHMETLIVEPINSDDPRVVKTQKMYFQSCLNDELDENRDRILIKKLLEVGDWPFLRKHNDWDEDNFDWVQVMIKSRDLGLPFEWFLKVDLFSDEKYELQISHPENCGSTASDDYFEMQADIIEKLIKPGLDTYSEFANLKDFEKRLNQICANNSDTDVTLRRMSYFRLDNVTTVMFLKMLTKLNKWKFDAPLAFNKNYIAELNQLLKRTPKKVQANYVLWKIIEKFAPYLSQPIRQRYAEFLNSVSGEEVSRFQFCLDDTKSKFKHVSEIVTLQQYAESSNQESGEELVDSIKEQIVTFIEDVDWRNNKTKESHLDFYGNLELMIGGPDDVFEEDFLTKHVETGKLEFFFDNIIQMIIDWSQSTFFAKMKMIGESTIQALSSVYESNSQFIIVLDEAEELLILPASAFGSFLFHDDLPQYINYAGLGAVTAEQLIQGLHLTTKSRFESYKGLEENTKCLMESLHQSNKHINASYTFLKNYKSLMGQMLAYKAYQNYVEDNEKETTLANLQYSPNQLFWIKSSMNWCYQPLPEEADEEAMNERQVRKYRIIEAAKNSEFFAVDFNCSSEAAMNPKNKCQML